MRKLGALAIVLCCFVLLGAGKSSNEATASEEILIPAGEFFMGLRDDAGDHPGHLVALDAFHLDKFEVTNRRYLAFCTETERSLPEFWGQDRHHSGEEYLDHPVIGVSWHDARAYAEWAGKRLPTEAEFEYAARGGRDEEPFPWGDEITPEHANYARSETNATQPVGSYAPNGYGLHDMTGNVSEWVIDAYDKDYYRNSPARNPTGPEEGRYKVIRGGGWHTGPGCIRVHFRNALPSNWVDFSVGFRCARSLED
jgi:sulfatase modifying factor 1